MSNVLAELQAGYDQRAKQAAQAPEKPQDAPQAHYATRTYTGRALGAHRAWGFAWGNMIKAETHRLRQEGIIGE